MASGESAINGGYTMKRLFLVPSILFCASLVQAQGGAFSQRVNYTTLDPPTSCVPGKLYTNKTVKKVWLGTSVGGCEPIGSGGSGAPTTATYITQTANGSLSAEQALASLATGILKNTTTTGVLSIAVAGDFPTLNQNTTGTAVNLSGTPALPNGTTATTQSQADASTKLATTAYVDTGLGGKAGTGAVGSSGLTMNTNKLLGRGTASSGAIEEITLGTNLSLTGTTLNAAGGSGTVNSGTANQVAYYAATGTAVSGGSNLVFNNSTAVLDVGDVRVDDVNNRIYTVTGSDMYFGSALHTTHLAGSTLDLSSSGTIALNSTTYQSCTALTTNGAGVIGCTASTAKVKKGFQFFGRGLDVIRKIQPQTFAFQEGTFYADGGKQHLGLVAENLQTANPLLVSRTGLGMLQPEPMALAAIQIAALKELDARITKLEKANARLRLQLKRRHH